jgi:hypothetical protein
MSKPDNMSVYEKIWRDRASDATTVAPAQGYGQVEDLEEHPPAKPVKATEPKPTERAPERTPERSPDRPTGRQGDRPARRDEGKRDEGKKE